jgi:hypothetical protein
VLKICQGEVYVPSSMNNSVFVYNWDGRFIKQFSTKDWGDSSSPSDVRINSAGMKFVWKVVNICKGELVFTDTGAGRVLIVK